MSFWTELRRRNVYKVGAAYALVAWILAQAISIINEPLALPAWFDTTALILLALGFPIALLFAWAYELTPSGLQRTEDVPAQQSVTQETGQKLNYLLLGLVGGAVISTGAYWVFGRDTDARWMREEAIPALERLLEAGDWEQAFVLAERAEARVGESPVLDEIWPRLSWRTTITSDPPGATVYRRAYDAPEGDWQELGRTPLENIRIPFGLTRLRLEREGYLPLLRTVGGGIALPELAQL